MDKRKKKIPFWEKKKEEKQTNLCNLCKKYLRNKSVFDGLLWFLKHVRFLPNKGFETVNIAKNHSNSFQ